MRHSGDHPGRGAVTTLAGLALNAVLGLWWADPVAALVIALFLVREALEAWRGDEDGELGG